MTHEELTTLTFEELVNILATKVYTEFAQFKTNTLNCTKEEIFRKCYEINAKESYQDFLAGGIGFDTDEEKKRRKKELIIWLIEKDNLLDFIYDEWLSFDGAYSEDWDNLYDVICTIYDEEMKSR